MKILVFNLNFKLLPFIYNDVISLNKKHDVSVLCETSDIDNQFESTNVATFSRNKKSISSLIKNFLIRHDLKLSHSNKKLKSTFKKYITNLKPDIIQCHFGDEALIFLDNIDVEELKIPIIVMFHGYDASAWLRNKTYIKKYKKLLQNGNISAIVCSEDMKLRMVEKGFPEDKLTVIYYGVDVAIFNKELPEEIKTKFFTQVSVFRKKKGLETTIRAFKLYSEKYNDTDFKLILAGDGPLKEELQNLTRELNMEEIISFPGRVNLPQVKELLDQADYFVHHSITNTDGDMEGIPNAIIEAMAMNLPVISTFHSGIPELVSNHENGILVNEFDIAAYSDAIKHIQEIEFSEKNRKKVYEKFNLENRIKLIEECFLKKTSNEF